MLFVDGRTGRVACCLFYLQGAKLLNFPAFRFRQAVLFVFAVLNYILRSVLRYTVYYIGVDNIISRKMPCGICCCQ